LPGHLKILPGKCKVPKKEDKEPDAKHHALSHRMVIFRRKGKAP
jgi:hypothetical protein